MALDGRKSSCCLIAIHFAVELSSGSCCSLEWRLYLFAAYGFPGGDVAGEGGMSYVFNGDFVAARRSSFSVSPAPQSSGG